MITVEHLTKTFRSPVRQPGLGGAIRGLFSREYKSKMAVNDISFHIGEGEIVGYIGANGAGKSTTIKMMCGILTPTSGSCTVGDLVPYRDRRKNATQIGVVFGQRTQLWWDLPLTETYNILKEIYQVPQDVFATRMAYLKEVLGIHDFMSSTVRTLSLGQRMRADLAASLLHNPRVLYLDEPTIGLDVMVKSNIRAAIKEINANYKTTIVLTTHDLQDIEELCNRIIIIDDGRKLYDGALQDIKERFGKTKTVTLECAEHEVFHSLAAHFGLSENSITTQIADGQVRITFDKDVLTVSALLSYVLQQAPVSDISIEETEIEDIVKQIYNQEIKL